MAGLFGYVDPALGGAQGVANIVGGVQEGDPEQVVRGVGDTLGAYTTANSIVMSQAYDAALIYATEELGLGGQAAITYAESAAESAGLTGASTISSWLPFIGAGLSIWDIAEHGPNIYNMSGAMGGTTAGIAALVGGSAGLAALPGLMVGGMVAFQGWRNKEKWEKGRKRVFFQNSSVTPVGTDEEGWHYLQLSHGMAPTGFDWGDKGENIGSAYMFRYNPETNELQQTKWYQTSQDGRTRSNYGLSTEEWKQIHDGGYSTETIENPPNPKWSAKYNRTHKTYTTRLLTKEGDFNVPEDWINLDEFGDDQSRNAFDQFGSDELIGYKKNRHGNNAYYIIKKGRDGWTVSSVEHVSLSAMSSYEWEDFNSSDSIQTGHDDRHILIWNTDQLQASIYNDVLVPEGLAPSITETFTEITVNGENYLTDGIYVANTSGQLLGKVNRETGDFYDFNITGGWRFDSDFEKPRNDQPPPYNVLGTIDNWDQISAKFDPSQPSSSTTAEALLPGQDSTPQPTATLSGGGLFGTSTTASQLLPSAEPVQPSGGLFGVTPPTSPQQGQQPYLSPYVQENLISTGTIPGQPDNNGGGGLGGNSMGLFDTTTTTTSGGEAEKTQAPGPMPAGGDAIWQEYLNTVFGSPGEGEPPYLASALGGHQAAKDQSNAAYVKSIEQAAKPYNQAVDEARANPINISFGGRPVGNVMMQGGMAAEKERMGVNMLAPAQQYDYSQQNTPYTAYLSYVDYLGKTGMEMQKMAYGVPSTTVTGSQAETEEKTPSVTTQVDNWMGIIGDISKNIEKGYDLGKSWGWWG